MMATRTIALALGLITGIIIATTGQIIPAPLLIAVGLIALFTMLYEIREEHRWREQPVWLVFAAAFLLAVPPGYIRTRQTIGAPSDNTLRSILAKVAAGSQISIRGKIVHEPELRKAGQLDLVVRVTELRDDSQTHPHWISVRSGRLLTRVYAQKSSTAESKHKLEQLASPDSYGYQIEFSSRYKPVTTTLNPGEFDYGRFLQAGGLATRLRAHINRVTIIAKTRGNYLTELALMAKKSFIRTYRHTIRAPASLLVAAATLGTRHAVEHVKYRGYDISQMFRHAGVGHVLAVSGIHVTVVTVLLFSLFRIIGMRPRHFVPPLILFLVLFALLTGARPSSLRAVIMNSVVLITLAYFPCGLRRATAMGLAVSSFLILLFNPTVLFAPSFLLSYGAVISLILLSPPVDHWLCTFRGFSLAFLLSWIVGFVAIAITHFEALANIYNITAIFGSLWLLRIIGNRLNHRYPKAWSYGLERLPMPVRLFLFAQFAIQLGMMVPMSSWFFGQFPIAGMLVNLIAIPLVAVIVQVGMLTGLVGLIPGIGVWLALPFGATVTIVANLFYLSAWAGTVCFPYPATPRPTLAWMLGYYAVIAAIVIADTYRVKLVALLYRLTPSRDKNIRHYNLLVIIPVAMLLLPLINLTTRVPRCTGITCLADGRYPIITITLSNRSAILINAGADLTGERMIFNALREAGANRVTTAILPSPDPRVGLEGYASLMNKMRVDTCLLGVLPQKGRNYIDAIGDSYLKKQAVSGDRWATTYIAGYTNLLQKARQHKTIVARIASAKPLAVWRDGSLRALPRFNGKVRRFVAAARTPMLTAEINGQRWLIITDTTYGAVKETFPEKKHYDVLVVPNLSSRKSYSWWLKYLLRQTTPQQLIIAGETPADIDTGYAPNTIVYSTGRDGAITAIPQPDSKSIIFTKHLKPEWSRISLPSQATAPNKIENLKP